jgi:hypothetical protein
MTAYDKFKPQLQVAAKKIDRQFIRHVSKNFEVLKVYRMCLTAAALFEFF